ncbi:MAG: cupin-like domain-containing protein [Kofleriaceae bacterium]|nr:cupin-like domain-containing protein [Kofleriaceae bacterium]
MMADNTQNSEFSPVWIAWVADNLLLGASEREIESELMAEGASKTAVANLIRELRDAPWFQLTTKYSQRAHRSEMIVRLQRERGKLFRLETRTSLSAREFHSLYRANNCPVLLPDFAQGWPALNHWSMQWLKDNFGSELISYCDGRSRDPEYDRNAAELSCETKVGQLVDRILSESSTNDFYAVARNRNLQSSLSALWQDIVPLPGYLQRGLDNNSAALWIGPAGTITPLHHDTSDILFTQVVGRKRIRIIAPYHLSVSENAKGLYGPSLDELKGSKDVVIHDLELGPGDTVFIPVGWWHEVHALTPSMSVAINAFPDNDLAWYQPGARR